MKKKLLAKKQSKITPALNNRIIRVDGQSYLVRVQSLGSILLADAEPIPQGREKPINLFGRDKLATSLRNTVEMGLFS